MDGMAKITHVKSIIDASIKQTIKNDGLVELEVVFSPLSFDLASDLVLHDLIGSVYTFYNNNKKYNREISTWLNLPDAIKNLNLSSVIFEINLKQLRMNNVHIYENERELVDLCPMAPERFLILNLSLNSNKCTICPDEYNKNEIYRYFQLKTIWQLLSSFSDDEKETELVFLYKQKVSLKLNYSFDDLGSEFYGLDRLLAINSEEGHAGTRKNIMQNTLHSLLWKEDATCSLKILLRKFSLFVRTFEENYRAFTVGFSFDKVRKEYIERFREYLAKMNGIIYESLTRALAIPITGLIGFVAMNNDDDIKSVLINIAALILVIFSTIGTHYLVLFQIRIVSVTRSEFSMLFSEIKDELEGLDVNELEVKEAELHRQATYVSKLLLAIYAIALTNFIVNCVMFALSTF